MIVGIEARGFILGGHLAKRMNSSILMCRKKGKLPPPVISQEYELEYGTDTLEELIKTPGTLGEEPKL